jgi:hypothetical protein
MEKESYNYRGRVHLPATTLGLPAKALPHFVLDLSVFYRILPVITPLGDGTGVIHTDIGARVSFAIPLGGKQ